ncbi:MAG: ABC transporter permease, partial [Halanaerobiales bacterium]
MSDLFSLIFTADFLGSVIRMSTPILFVALAALVGSKADVLCIAYEGIMLFAAFGGVVGSAYTGTIAGGLFLGLLLGMLLIGIFAYFVLYLHTKPLLIGLALNILGSAGTVFG